MAGEGLNSGLDYDSDMQQALVESRRNWQRIDQGRIERAMHASCGTAEDDELIRTIQDMSLQDFEEEENRRFNPEIIEPQGRDAPQVEFAGARSPILRSGNAYQSDYASGNQPSSVPLSMPFVAELPAQSILNEDDTAFDLAIALSLQTQYEGHDGRRTPDRSSPLSRSDSPFSRDSGYQSLARTSMIRGSRFNNDVPSGTSPSTPPPEVRNQFYHRGDIYNIHNYHVDGELSNDEPRKQPRMRVPQSAALDGLYQRQSSEGSAQTSKPEHASSKKSFLQNVLKKVHLRKIYKNGSVSDRGEYAEPSVRPGHSTSLSDSVSQWVRELPGGWNSDTASELGASAELDRRLEHARSAPTTISGNSTYYTALEGMVDPLLSNDSVLNGSHGHRSPTPQISTVSHTYDAAPVISRSTSVASSRLSPMLEMPGRSIHIPHSTQTTEDGDFFEAEGAQPSSRPLASIPHPQEIRERLLQIRNRQYPQSHEPEIAFGTPPRARNMQSAVPNENFIRSQTSIATLPPTSARMDYEAGRQHHYVPLRTDLANLVPPPGQNLRNWNTHGTRDLDRHAGGGHIPLQGVNLPSLPGDRHRRNYDAPLRRSETSLTRARRMEKERQKTLRRLE